MLVLLTSMWPVFFDHVSIEENKEILIGVFSILSGFVTVAVTIERNIDWLRAYSWRHASVERKIAESNLNRQALLMFLFLFTLLLMLIHALLSPDNIEIRVIIAKFYLSSGTAAMLWVLLLPFEIRRMRLLPYDDILAQQQERGRGQAVKKRSEVS